MKKQIEEFIYRCLEENFGVSHATPSSKLRDDLALDSIETAQLIIEVENFLGYQVDDEENFYTIQDIINAF